MFSLFEHILWSPLVGPLVSECERLKGSDEKVREYDPQDHDTTFGYHVSKKEQSQFEKSYDYEVTKGVSCDWSPTGNLFYFNTSSVNRNTVSYFIFHVGKDQSRDQVVYGSELKIVSRCGDSLFQLS